MDERKQRTIREYDKNPAEFDRRFQDFFSRREEQVTKFVTLLPGNEVLDLCCGSGVYSTALQQRGISVIGVDISEGLLAIARSRGVDARHMDIENLAFSKNSLDGVFANAALVHTPKTQAREIVRSIYDLLRPGGILYVSLREGTFEGCVAEAIGPERYFVYWTEQELLAATTPYFERIDTYEIQEKYRWLFGFFRKR